MLGKFFEPLGVMAGLHWQLIVALFLAFSPKKPPYPPGSSLSRLRRIGQPVQHSGQPHQSSGGSGLPGDLYVLHPLPGYSRYHTPGKQKYFIRSFFRGFFTPAGVYPGNHGIPNRPSNSSLSFLMPAFQILDCKFLHSIAAVPPLSGHAAGKSLSPMR